MGSQEQGGEAGAGGVQVAWMSPAWPISADAEAWTSNIQGVEVPWPLDPAQKDTQQRNQEPEYTMR